MVKINVSANLRKNGKTKAQTLSFDTKKLNIKKITKTCAQYKHGGGRDRCMNCMNFVKRPFVDSCTRVIGSINQTYTCNLFVPSVEFLKESGKKAIGSFVCTKK